MRIITLQKIYNSGNSDLDHDKSRIIQHYSKRTSTHLYENTRDVPIWAAVEVLP